MKGNPKIRYCEICGNRLSRYNPEEICFHHQPGMSVIEHFPVSLCIGYENVGHSDDGIAYPKPGDPGYNELAFTQSIMGVVSYNADGEVDMFNI